MLKDFWNNHKYIIEIVAIFIALGALFLAIPLPLDNPGARVALLNVQTAWLLIVSVAIIILFISFFVAFFLVEKKVSEQKNIDVGATISLFVIIFLFWIIYWLWQYLIAQYHEPLKNLLSILVQPLALIDVALFVFVGRRLVSEFGQNSKFYIHSILFVILNGLIAGGLTSLMYLDIKLLTFFENIGAFSFLALFYEVLCVIRFKNKQKKKIETQTL